MTIVADGAAIRSQQSPAPRGATAGAATFVLIPGAWHGSWCWTEIAPLLEARGHRVLAPDLPGAADGADPADDGTLARWTASVSELVAAERDPVVLVGHSLGGLIVSAVAEAIPHQVSLAVYLCAFLLEDGQTLSDVAQRADNAAAFGAIIEGRSDGTILPTSAGARSFFYNTTPDALVERAQGSLQPLSADAFATPIHVTEARFGAVPRAYIECLRDRAIPIATQREMQVATPVDLTERLDSDHSPFFSLPVELAAVLDRLGAAVGSAG